MKKSFIILCILLGLSLLLPSGLCSAESVYQVTETELVQLENNLQALSQQRQLLLNELKRLSNEQIALEKELAELKVLSSQQETQLKIANESLKEYAAEEKSKRLRIKRQRNLYFCCFLAAGMYAVAK